MNGRRSRTPGPVTGREADPRRPGPVSGPLFAEPETAPRIETRDIVATLPVVELVEPDPVALQPVALEEVLLPLWEDAPRPEDVEQGEMGNCPLAATFIAMAHTRPRTLMERIREEPAEVRSRRRSDPPGTFPYRATRIYRAAFAGYPEATVSSLLYRTHGNIAYARSAGGRVAWVSFLEKAYVVARNASYEQMNVTGGRGGWPMDQIFRDVAGEYAFLDFGADPPPSSAEVRRMVERASSRPTIAGTETGVLETEGIVAHHAYAVLGWTRNRVQLRDPRGGVNAVKQLSLEDFQRTFRLLLQTAEEAG
jgi:hypothetical protein